LGCLIANHSFASSYLTKFNLGGKYILSTISLFPVNQIKSSTFQAGQESSAKSFLQKNKAFAIHKDLVSRTTKKSKEQIASS
jgi:hypothetical protein